MLSYFAERFGSTEINYSFRRISGRKTIESWANATPPRFKFSFKAPQKVTHFSRLRDSAETLRYFNEAIAPLRRKLGAVLFQLPPNLKKDTPLLNSFLKDLPHGMRAAFEFRHDSWFEDEVFMCLRKHKAALCIAESEEIATPAVATANFGYLRLRREDYRAADLRRWAEFVKTEARWRDAFMYFKHEGTGAGPKFAAQFKKLTDA